MIVRPCDTPMFAAWLPCCERGRCDGRRVWGRKTDPGRACPWVTKARGYYREMQPGLDKAQTLAPGQAGVLAEILTAFRGRVHEMREL